MPPRVQKMTSVSVPLVALMASCWRGSFLFAATSPRRWTTAGWLQPALVSAGPAPVAVVLLVVVALGALAIPMKDLHLAFPTDSTASADSTQRKASDLVADAFGPGRDAPLLVVVDGRDVPADDRPAAYGEVVVYRHLGPSDALSASDLHLHSVSFSFRDWAGNLVPINQPVVVELVFLDSDPYTL